MCGTNKNVTKMDLIFFITFQSVMFTAWKVTACNVATCTPSTWGWGGGSCHITSCNCPPKGHYAMWRGITWHDHRTITSHERRRRDVHCRAVHAWLSSSWPSSSALSISFVAKKNSVSLSQVKKPKLDSTPKSSKKKEKIKFETEKEKKETRNLQLNYLLREIFAKVVS
jgi:hypothetical protein